MIMKQMPVLIPKIRGKTFLEDEEGEESAETESSNSKKVGDIISRRKGIITNVNIEEIKEGDVYNERHDNISGGNCDYKRC